MNHLKRAEAAEKRAMNLFFLRNLESDRADAALARAEKAEAQVLEFQAAAEAEGCEHVWRVGRRIMLARKLDAALARNRALEEGLRWAAVPWSPADSITALERLRAIESGARALLAPAQEDKP